MYTRMLSLAALLPLTATIGCGGDFCSKFYDKMKECSEGDDKDKIPEKAKFVEECQAEQKKDKEAGKHDEEEEKAMSACMDKGSCDDVKKCMSEESEKRYVKKQIAEIKEAAGSGDAAKMKDACQYINEENTELVEACKEVFPKLVEVTSADVTKQRDEGKHDFGTCMDLERFAKSAGGDAEAKAKTLCEESQAAEKAKKAIDEAGTNVQAKKADIPYECGAAIEELSKIESEWAKAKKGEVAKACFVDLGKVVMAANVPDMKYVCDFHVKEVYKAVKEHNLEDPDLATWMEKAKPLCEKEG